MQNAGHEARTLRSYGNLNQVIAKSVLASVDIENRKPADMTTESIANSIIDVELNKSLTQKILSRRRD